MKLTNVEKNIPLNLYAYTYARVVFPLNKLGAYAYDYTTHCYLTLKLLLDI